MEKLRKTVLHDKHLSLGAKMVEFGGWEMPIHYRAGIVMEHLSTRKRAGLFDVSHMGRFVIRGEETLRFLQYVLTNNAAALQPGESQYTIIPDEQGAAIDDAYLFRLPDEEFLLVVNATNTGKVWNHLNSLRKGFSRVEMLDHTDDLAMVSVQGPLSKKILSAVLPAGSMPEPVKNAVSAGRVDGAEVFISRTGYTGEPLGFELFINSRDAPMLWDRLSESADAEPIGLGARDTLRLEAGLPLFGHELGSDPEGRGIPIFSLGFARLAVSFSPLKGPFVGKEALLRQFESLKGIIEGEAGFPGSLQRIMIPVALKDRGVARRGSMVFAGGRHVGYVTSGTMIPYWKSQGVGLGRHLTDEKGMRAICLALVDSDLAPGDDVEIDIRGKKAGAIIVPYHLRSEAPPFARPILYDQLYPQKHTQDEAPMEHKILKNVEALVNKAVSNTVWRRQQCINLIPSEQTPSAMTRLLSIADPVGRYAEHRKIKALGDVEIFYYQGTDFIREVEELLNRELRLFLGCGQVETRIISGQMANMAVFSAMMDHLNRTDRKSEQRRIRKVLNHHIIRGGHLSAQPMGALRDFVMRDPTTEKPSVVHFPVLKENPYQVDVEACRHVIATHRPELVIFGKSLTLHREPVAQVRAMVNELSLHCFIVYDMAHVLGLVGPHFQEPFKDGADLVTGSTHKTFFGTQRGLIAANLSEGSMDFDLWEAIERRTFPGSVSNHHLGTLLGLLLAAYEMNFFKEAYQRQVLGNAKAFARALKDCGLEVAGDPTISYTETHQVVVHVGYGRGPEIARKLEENNIIVNFQARPDDEGFTAAGALRTGVAEMTRFGMKEEDFQHLAQIMADAILRNRPVREEVTRFRRRFLDMEYCFSGKQVEDLIQRLHELV